MPYTTAAISPCLPKTIVRSWGGAYIGHPTLRPFKVYIKNQNHPITEGIQDFIVNDEQHFVAYDKDPKYILAESDNLDRLQYENHGTRSMQRGRTITVKAVWFSLRLAIPSMRFGFRSI